MQSKEKIMKMLDLNGIKFIEPECNDTDYNRWLDIECYDFTIKLEWWSNIGYIFIGEVQLPFDKIEVDGCWPNKFKVNINLSYAGTKTAIIPIVE